eukprot:c11520_g1_i1.p1 GENE.c11520_g1_i1~~c11520_g1_i1.p1  ORF type:complete len:192 (-),score=21.68 c11520_g1_i1:32-607(-)
MVLRWFVRQYRTASVRLPLTIAFATCFVKGSASDCIAQTIVENKTSVDPRRNFGFALFSGGYCGVFQHFVYNVAMVRAFGVGTGVAVIVKKVLADGLIHTPLICFPIYYMSESTILGASPIEGLKNYSKDWWGICKAYWMLWTPVHVVSFKFVPTDLRIGFIATVSFFWLVILSFKSHQTIIQNKLAEKRS